MNLCQFYFVTTLILYEFYSAFCLLKINSIFTLSFLPFLRLHGRNRRTDLITEDWTKTDEEAADIDSPQGRSGDPQPAAARGDDGSTARGDEDAAARGEDGSAARGEDVVLTC